MSVHVLEQFDAPAASPPADRMSGAVVGCGLSGALVAVLASEAHLDLIDFDVAESRQAILPPLNTSGRPKAALAHAYRRDRFPWLGPERALVAAAEEVGDGYWRSLARVGGVLLACTDAIATQTHLARIARRHGLPMVATGLGPDAVEVLVVPAARDAACYGCLGRDPARPPMSCFLDTTDAVPANAPSSPPTNSSLHLAALAATTAIAEARALAAGATGHAELLSLAPGRPILRAQVTPRARCPVCADAGDPLAGPTTPLVQSSRDRFGAIGDTLGVRGEEAQVVLPGPAARALFCPDCRRYVRLPHLLLGRRIRCGACGSDGVLAAETIAAGTRVPLAAARNYTPAELGWPWWPVIEIHRGRSRLFVELAGDAADAGEVVTIEPLLIGGETDAH